MSVDLKETPAAASAFDLDPEVQAQLAAITPPDDEEDDDDEPEAPPTSEVKPRRGRRAARQAAAEEANRNTPVMLGHGGPIQTGVEPESPDGLSRNEKIDVLWDWFTNTGSKLHAGSAAASEGDTDLMRCEECGQTFEAPSYAIRLRDGLPARCPNPIHGTRLYPAEFVTA